MTNGDISVSSNIDCHCSCAFAWSVFCQRADSAGLRLLLFVTNLGKCSWLSGLCVLNVNLVVISRCYEGIFVCDCKSPCLTVAMGLHDFFLWAFRVDLEDDSISESGKDFAAFHVDRPDEFAYVDSFLSSSIFWVWDDDLSIFCSWNDLSIAPFDSSDKSCTVNVICLSQVLTNPDVNAWVCTSEYEFPASS